jgi:cytochrome b561
MQQQWRRGEGPGGGARFDGTTIALHWLALLLVVLLFGTAWTRSFAEDAASADRLLALHRAAGVLLWVLTLARIGWRLTGGARVRLDLQLPRAQRVAARATEYGLLALLIVQPVLGLAHSLSRGRTFDLLVLTVPPLLPPNRAASHLLHELHEQAAWLLLVLIGIHAAAALFHRFAMRDRVLQSMLPVAQRGCAAGE